MPRTIAAECPGCPPLRSLTTDVLGLVKVVEARGKSSAPKVVETWGEPDTSRGILAASFADRETNPILAVARKNGSIEFLNTLNGDVVAATKAGDYASEDDPVVGLHLLKTKQSELASKLSVFLTCTSNAEACLRSIYMKDAKSESEHTGSTSKWLVSNAGQVFCTSVDDSEHHALFGGKGIEVNVWDIEKCSNIWTAKSPRTNSIGIFTPTWFTAATFLSKDDYRKIAAGTNNHQIRLYDLSAQRRPVISVDFRESSIKAVTEDLDGYTIYVGTGTGDLASFDMRTGKLLGCFIGKCSGSIRSITRHPKLPVIASCGLDSYLRIWDVKTRQLLAAVFLKQHLTNAVIDSHFFDKEFTSICADKAGDSEVIDQSEDEDEEEVLQHEGRNKSKSKGESMQKAGKGKGNSKLHDHFEQDEDETFKSKSSQKSRDKKGSDVASMKSKNGFGEHHKIETEYDDQQRVLKRRKGSDVEEHKRKHREKNCKMRL